jgi:hypothetical protein
MVPSHHFNFSILQDTSKWLTFHGLPRADNPSAVTLKDETDLFPWRKEIQTTKGMVRNIATGRRKKTKLMTLNSYIGPTCRTGLRRPGVGYITLEVFKVKICSMFICFVTSCWLVEGYQCFGKMYHFPIQCRRLCSECGVSVFFLNVGNI